jgi:hypothetical protein
LSNNNDYSPVVDEGELEGGTGLLGRLRRREELGPVGAGYVRILLDTDRAAVAGGEQLSAGEKYWSRAARSWVKVDVGEHPLAYDVGFLDPSGQAGFVATVSVRCSVKDPAAAATQGATGVRQFVEPAIQQAVARASRDIPPATEVDGPIAVLTRLLDHADATVRESVSGAVDDLPRWLEARVTSARVQFDEATAKHRAELVATTRDIDMTKLTGDKDRLAAENEMRVRTIVRESLGPYLANPVMRSFETVFANPSPENIDRVVNQVTANDHELVLGILQNLADNDFIDKGDAAVNAAIDALLAALKGVPFKSAAELGGGDSSGALGGGGDDDEDVFIGDPPITEVHEAVEAHEDPGDEDVAGAGDENVAGDRSWSD